MYVDGYVVWHKLKSADNGYKITVYAMDIETGRVYQRHHVVKDYNEDLITFLMLDFTDELGVSGYAG